MTEWTFYTKLLYYTILPIALSALLTPIWLFLAHSSHHTRPTVRRLLAWVRCHSTNTSSVYTAVLHAT